MAQSFGLDGRAHERTQHLSLDKTRRSPDGPLRDGAIVGDPEVGGLHHPYERRAD